MDCLKKSNTRVRRTWLALAGTLAAAVAIGANVPAGQPGVKRARAARTPLAAAEKKRIFTWRDWNSKPTPQEGKRVGALYEFNKYVICELDHHRFEFNLNQKVRDAYLIYCSFCSSPDSHCVRLNGKEFIHVSGKVASLSEVPLVRAVDNLRPGANVATIDGCWLALELVINLEDGSQRDLTVGPGWQSYPRKEAGWDTPGYRGPTGELAYRLGGEGYFRGSSYYLHFLKKCPSYAN